MSNSPDQQIHKSKKLSPILLLSGIFVAISFMSMLIPFALYSIAQVSAMVGKRYGLLVSFCVFVALCVVGIIFNSSFFLFGSFLLLLSIPFFMIAIVLRDRFTGKIAPSIVLLIPLLFIFGSTVTFTSNDFNRVEKNIEQALILKKQETEKQVETNVSAASKNSNIKAYDSAISFVQSIDKIPEIRDFLSYNIPQKLAWFVFGPGSLLLFFALLTSFANIVFLDLAFEQVEKIKAILVYVLKNASHFSYDFVLALSQMPLVLKEKELTNSFCVIKHEVNPTLAQHGINPNVKVIKLSLFKNPNPHNKMYLKGYAFLFEGKPKSLNLKLASLPLPLVIVSIAFMAGAMFTFGGAEELIAALSAHHFAGLIALGCVLSYACLSILTLQGLLAFYSRVSNLIGLVFLLFLFLLGSAFSVGFYAIIAIFGSIALLDYVYDWRKTKLR